MGILENILTITGAIGTIYGGVSWLYNHKIKFYLFVNKILSSRREIKFDLSTSFIKTDKLNFKEIENIFNNNNYSFTKQKNLKNSELYNLENFILEVKQIDGETEDERVVNIRVINAAVTYKTALGILSDYKKILELIFESLNVRSRDTSSSLTLKYGDKNPFMGRNLANLNKESIKSFSCQVDFNKMLKNDDPTADEANIFIYKESINYTTNNLNDLINVAKLCFNTYK